MALELAMIGLIVNDMGASLAFYRQLGLAVPEDSDTKTHVEIKMGGLTFFLDSRPGRWDPQFTLPPAEARAVSAESYQTVLEFFLPTTEALDTKYAELTDLGYRGFREPYRTSFGMYFAMVQDPDGHTILLSSELREGPA
jgi:predicted lactoylglutathione lyase